MSRTSVLGDLLTTLAERSRAWAAPSDDRGIYDLSLALLSEKGEVSGLQIASTILERYESLDSAEKHAFFTFLTFDLDIDAARIAEVAQSYADAPDTDQFSTLMSAAEAPRQELLRRLNQVPGGTAKLVAMRVDLLKRMVETPAFARTDYDFRHLLRSWFNRGFLVLRQIDWSSSAAVLEKIIAYEAVHAIQDWDDLRRRLYPTDRRCFAFFHPAMPDEPLIFVEVALTQNVPNSIQRLLADDREIRPAHETKTAVFYSISNCQEGLRGISFGNSLIKQVVAELSRDLPQLTTFVTLSPLPRFNGWMKKYASDPQISDVLNQVATPELTTQVAAHYLLNAKHARGGPYDPVARFHLGNGATVHDVHAGADLTVNGQRQSSGVMVNYLYALDAIEKNHMEFVENDKIAASRKVASLARAAPEPVKE